tara:strand:+ start:7183 stop:7593 length:411 start_codon:yes stop_codon:yes gene_type:complete
MKIEEYDALITAFRSTGDKQAQQKRIEYTESRGDEDVLANFKATATSLELEPIQVLGVFMQKHYSSIVNYIKTGKSYSEEDISSRIMDLIQYLELTYACINERDDTPHVVICAEDPKVINKETMSLLSKKRGTDNG